MVMVPCEQKPTTKQVLTKKKCYILYSYPQMLSLLSSSPSLHTDHFLPLPAGPHAAHAEILLPPEDGVHRQALLL